MPRNISKSFKANVSTISCAETPAVLIEITHESLANPVRVTNAGADIISNSNLFINCPFRVTLPSDNEGSVPVVTLELTNIGRSLSYWIDQSLGARDAQARIMLVMKSNPDQVEYEICTDIQSMTMNMVTISARLGFENLLNKRSVPIIYNFETAPGLF